MKLRFRRNSLRLRLTQSEVKALAASTPVEEIVHFPGGPALAFGIYASQTDPRATFDGRAIRVEIPAAQLKTWAEDPELGLYYEFPVHSAVLRVAVEKDLECVDAPPEEREPDAFPRHLAGKNC